MFYIKSIGLRLYIYKCEEYIFFVGNDMEKRNEKVWFGNRKQYRRQNSKMVEGSTMINETRSLKGRDKTTEKPNEGIEMEETNE